MNRTLTALAIAAAATFSQASNADVMTFTGFSGSANSITEAGMTLTNVNGDTIWTWDNSNVHQDGYGLGSGFWRFTTGGVFSFDSVDFLGYGGQWAGGRQRWEGYLNNVLVASLEFANPGVDTTINFSAAFGAVDRVELSNNYHFSFDNVTFNANNVPEPGSLALMGLSLAGLAVARRRKA